MTRILKAVPLSIGAAALAAGALLLMANLALPLLGHGVMKLTRKLTGVTSPEQPQLSLGTVLNGSFQSATAMDVGTKMPLYPDAVRLRNQVELSVFGTSAIPSTMVGPWVGEGRGPALFEPAYAEEYCGRSIAAWQPGAERWAAQIREMQDVAERRGHAFLYVLSPSKISQYPGIIPPGYTCPATAADRNGIVPAWLAMLRAKGVHVVDTTAVMRAAQPVYPFTMFPRGGSHWNAVGAALSQQAVMAALDHIAPNRGFAPFTFTWQMIKHPVGLDVDVANLMNLLRPFPTDPVPVTALQPAPQATPCPMPRVVIIGGSFSHAMLDHLFRATCNHTAIEYEYWRAYTVSASVGGILANRGVNDAERDAAILAADVLVYEENEQVMPSPRGGEALYAFLHAHAVPAPPPSPP